MEPGRSTFLYCALLFYNAVILKGLWQIVKSGATKNFMRETVAKT